MSAPEFTKAYFIDLNDPNNRYEFDFNPEVGDKRGGDFPSEKIPGASHEQAVWGSGSARPLNCKARIVRLTNDLPPDHVKNQVNWLFAMTYPEESDDFDSARPPYLKFIMGALYDLPVRLKDVSITWGILDPKTLLPEHADATFVLEEVALQTIYKQDVLSNGSAFQRVSAGFGRNGS